jgi:hypothetical protein
VVLSVPPTIALAVVVGQLTGGRARLVNREPANGSGGDEPTLVWARGYGLFTLGPQRFAQIGAYVLE